jgi:hypothetical protein
VFLAAGSFVAKHFGSADDVDFLHIGFGGAFFVLAHGVLLSKRRAVIRRAAAMPPLFLLAAGK